MPGIDPGNPVRALLDCHRRIETFVEGLVRLNEAYRGAAMSDEDRDALRTAPRYVREAIPKQSCCK